MIPDIFSAIYERENLILVKDGEGNFWVPPWGSFLDDWDFREGYMAKLSAPDTLIITGEPVNPETVINLIRGWSMIAYFPEEQVDAVTAFANLEELLIIAKDGFGGFMAPEFDFNDMEELQQGRGYFVKVSEAVEFIWTE